jgi:hypothetical protein
VDHVVERAQIFRREEAEQGSHLEIASGGKFDVLDAQTGAVVWD